MTPAMKKKVFELQIALYIACKSSFAAVDDLSDILQHKFGDNVGKMHRTKCAALVKNVLAPHFRRELKKDFHQMPFSLLVDESTDISATKILAVSIRYFSKKMQNVISTYLAMEEIIHGDANSLFACIKKIMNDWDLRAEDMVGVGTDGASSMVGQHHSLQALLKREIPHLLHNRCCNHALDLAAKDAVQKSLPSHIEHMARASFRWFSHSSIRIHAYREIAALVGFSNTPDESDEGDNQENPMKTPCKLVSPSQTRWLAIHDCIEKILGQYDALKAHFEMAYQKERCYEAKILAEMYKDPQNRLYLIFLHPVLKELKQISTNFQSNKPDSIKLYTELEVYFMMTARRVLQPAIVNQNSAEQLCDLKITPDSDFYFLPPKYADLGATFLDRLDKAGPCVNKEVIKDTANLFLKHLFLGLQSRVKASLIMFKKMSPFQLPNFLEKSLNICDLSAPFFPQDVLALSGLEEKARIIKATAGWDTSSTDKFWISIHMHQDGSGSFPFREFSSPVIRMFCMPASNADIERVFSQVNVVKNQKRANMNTDTLNAALYYRFGMRKFNLTCAEFVPPKSILDYNSENLY